MAQAPQLPAASISNAPYGEHPRQCMDLWQAQSQQPTPVVVYLHGGAWERGDKRDIRKHGLGGLLPAGISIASINYRLIPEARRQGIQPPVSWPMQDIARAVQFVRSKADTWNLDPSRVALCGTSAGACSSLWLALHDDLADPESSNPVARQSTRVCCAAVYGAQTSLDPMQTSAWTPNSNYGGHAFGLTGPRNEQFPVFLNRREEFLPWIREYSPIEHASADDPPLFLLYDRPPTLGQRVKDPTHSANMGVKLCETLSSLGASTMLAFPGSSVEYTTMDAFLIHMLVGQ